MAVLNNQLSGTFTSTGVAKILNLPCDVDYVRVVNYTQMATQQATGRGVIFEWFSTMAADSAFEVKKTNATDALNGVVITSGGFTKINTSAQQFGTKTAITAVTKANPAVVSTASTSGLVAGDTVRMINVASMQQISGIPFTISSVVANTSFTLPYLDASGFANAGTTGFYQKINYPSLYYPYHLYITSITKASQAVITFSVTHNLTVGQVIRINVPASFGMTEINGLSGRIVAINTTNNTVTVDINSTSFTTFAFPASGSVPTSWAQAIPYGDLPATLANTSANQSVLDGATYNQSVMGLLLAAGAQSPAGSSGDVIHWVATKSSAVQSS